MSMAALMAMSLSAMKFGGDSVFKIPSNRLNLHRATNTANSKELVRLAHCRAGVTKLNAKRRLKAKGRNTRRNRKKQKAA